MHDCRQGFFSVHNCISIGALCFLLVGCAGVERRGRGQPDRQSRFRSHAAGRTPTGLGKLAEARRSRFPHRGRPWLCAFRIELRGDRIYERGSTQPCRVDSEHPRQRPHSVQAQLLDKDKGCPAPGFLQMDHPQACAYVDFLDVNRQSLPANGHYYESSSVFMTHDWTRRELSFRTPEGTSYVKVNLAFASVVGTVYFDSVSLVASPFQKVASPDWLKDAVVYELAPWVFSQFGNGRAFQGILSKLPALQDLGVTMLYLLPVWEDQGGYAITDHYAVFRKYGSEQELKDLVAEAHQRRMKVILDLAGTIGVPKKSRLVREHPEWFILNPSNTLYVSWMAGSTGWTRIAPTFRSISSNLRNTASSSSTWTGIAATMLPPRRVKCSRM